MGTKLVRSHKVRMIYKTTQHIVMCVDRGQFETGCRFTVIFYPVISILSKPSNLIY
jgi:hypothetical protein